MKSMKGVFARLVAAVAFAIAFVFSTPIEFVLNRFAAIAGSGGNVKIGTTAVADIGNWKGDWGADMLEVTAFSSAGWKEFIAGLKEWSGTFEGNFNMGDTTGQKALQDAWLAGTPVSLKLYVDATHYYSGSAFVKKIGVETPVDDKVSVSYDFQGTGALAYT